VTVLLADEIEGITQPESYAQELQIGADLGLPTTVWQPIQVVVGILNVNATIVSNFSGTISILAQGAYASLASQMVDSSGAPITAWLDLRSADVYNTKRQPATFASGFVPLQNTSATNQPYGPTNPLHVQNQTTGATYTSQGTGTVTASATTNVQFQADLAGSAFTSGAGVVLILTTPLQGVSCLALVSALVGSDAESNAAFFARDVAKLGTIDNALAGLPPQAIPAAPDSAYAYVVTTIPHGSPSASPPYAVSAIITRVSVWIDIYSGDVNVYCANAAGSPGSTDLNVLNSAVQSLVAPDGQTANVLGVATVTITPTVTLYIRASTGVQPAAAITNAEDALANYAATVPIGGFTTNSPNIVPVTEILETLTGANPGTIDAEGTFACSGGVDLNGNPKLGQNGVPVFAAGSISVKLV
jgi:hypothetical protein